MSPYHGATVLKETVWKVRSKPEVSQSARCRSMVTVQATIGILEGQFDWYFPTLIALMVKLRLYGETWDHKTRHLFYNTEMACYATEIPLPLSITPSEPFLYDYQHSFLSKFYKVYVYLRVCVCIDRYDPGYRPTCLARSPFLSMYQVTNRANGCDSIQ